MRDVRADCGHSADRLRQTGAGFASVILMLVRRRFAKDQRGREHRPTVPVSRLRLMNPPAVLKAKLYNSATSSRLWPDCIAATARSRRSSEYGFALGDGPPCPSGNFESDSGLLGNPLPIRLSWKKL